MSSLVRRLAQPTGLVESTRWLFTSLVLLSLVFTVPAALAGLNAATSPSRAVATIGVAVITLVSSWLYGYESRSAPVAFDCIDAFALAAFASTLSDPVAVLSVSCSGLWFRSLYGPTWRRASLRFCLYGAAIIAAAPLWPLLHASAPPPTAVYLIEATFPVLALISVSAKQVGNGLLAHERSELRASALAVLGMKLLGVTDLTHVRRLARDAATEICAATPGLRLLKLARRDSALIVADSIGQLQIYVEYV